MTPNHGLPTGTEKADFERDGYHMIRSLLSSDEARHYRHCINRAFDLPAEDLDNARIDSATFTLADGMTTVADFWPVLFDDRLLGVVRALLGDDIRYAQHSDLHINLHGGRFHRDSACREYGVGPPTGTRVRHHTGSHGSPSIYPITTRAVRRLWSCPAVTVVKAG